MQKMFGNRNQSKNSSEFLARQERDPTLEPNSAAESILLIVLGAIIIIVSGLIILSFLMNGRLRQRPANIMIFSQACSDQFTALVFIPLRLVRNETSELLLKFLSCYMLYLSLLNLLVISIDRYLALNRPFLHRKYIVVKNTAKMLFVVWMAPFGVILIPLFWWGRPEPMKVYLYIIWSVILILVIIMTHLYIVATRGAKKTIHNRRISVSSLANNNAAALAQKELRVVHLFGLLLVFFLLAYLPILYINFCNIIGANDFAPQPLVKLSLYLLICNSVLNPISCIVLKRDFLYAIKRLLPYIQEDYTQSCSSSLSRASLASEPKWRTHSRTSNISSASFSEHTRRLGHTGQPGSSSQRSNHLSERSCFTERLSLLVEDKESTHDDGSEKCLRLPSSPTETQIVNDKYRAERPFQLPQKIELLTTLNFGTRDEYLISAI